MVWGLARGTGCIGVGIPRPRSCRQFVARDLALRSTEFEVAVTYGTTRPSIIGVREFFQVWAAARSAVRHARPVRRAYVRGREDILGTMPGALYRGSARGKPYSRIPSLLHPPSPLVGMFLSSDGPHHWTPYRPG